jgi:hypothetical protein
VNKFLIAPVIAVFLFATPYRVIAQANDPAAATKSVNQKTADSLEREMDMVDFINEVFQIHLTSKPDTLQLKPGKLFFAFVPAIGYTLEGSWLANISLNISFYTAKADSTNLSTITYGALYTIKHQFVMPIISDIWLEKNRIDLLGDWRFYRYPSYTYGLGGNTLESNADLIDYSYVRFYQEILGHFNSFYYFGGGVNYDNHFDIREEGINAEFDSYNKGAAKTISSGPVLHFMYDSRTNINNPRNASYASVTYRYNNPVFGSSNQWQSAFIELKEYLQISRFSPNTLCLWSWNVFTFAGNAPYFDLPSNGWDIYSNSGRGYIQGRFRGQNMVYDEAEYRFRITHNGLLGGVVFANAESVSQYPGNRFQYIDPGEGFGIRLKMNKYSDVNLCVDYAFGLYGSRGIFFNLGEVF